jgi:Demerecviridae HNH endonuclease
MIILHERLKEILDYNPDTGVFKWRCRNNKKSRFKEGDVAGSLNRKGYRRVTVDGREYKEHRLAWFYMTGTWPKMVDHKNRVRSDNRWDNLRLGNPSLNSFNKTPHKLSNTGIRGVYCWRPAAWCRRRGRGVARRAAVGRPESNTP